MASRLEAAISLEIPSPSPDVPSPIVDSTNAALEEYDGDNSSLPSSELSFHCARQLVLSDEEEVDKAIRLFDEIEGVTPLKLDARPASTGPPLDPLPDEKQPRDSDGETAHPLDVSSTADNPLAASVKDQEDVSGRKSPSVESTPSLPPPSSDHSSENFAYVT